MRKFGILLVLMVFTLVVHAQNGFLPQASEWGKAQETTTIQSIGHRQIDSAEMLWYEDFDGDTWSATSSEGEPVPENTPENWYFVTDSGFASHWRWDDAGPRGTYTSPGEDCTVPLTGVMNSPSESNGWLTLEADWFHTLSDCSQYWSGIIDSYVAYQGGIDFSGQDAVHLIFYQWGRFYCTDSEINPVEFSVSTDQGDSWSHVAVSPAENYEEYLGETEIDITNLVADESDVWFRFHMHDVSHFHWEIDDVRFVKPVDYDIASHDYWNDYMQYADDENINNTHDFKEGFYNYPWFIIQEFKGFHAAFHNFGARERSNLIHHIEIVKDDETVEHFTSSAVEAFMPGDRDTTMVQESWMPAGKGEYTIMHYPEADETETITSNDTLIRRLNITDSLLSPVNMAQTSGQVSPDNFGPFNEDGDGLGFQFRLPAPDLHGQGGDDFYTLNGMHVFVNGRRYEEELAMFENGEAAVKAVVYKYNPKNAVCTVKDSSDIVPLSIDDTASVVYIPFVGDSAAQTILQAGNYLAVIHMFGTWRTAYGELKTWSIRNTKAEIQKYSRDFCLFVDKSVTTSNQISTIMRGPALALDISFSEQYTSTGWHDEQSDREFFAIYPNPSGGTVHIDVNAKSNVTFYDTGGRTIKQTTVEGSSIIDLGQCLPGIYYVKIENENYAETRQLIIQ